MTNVQRIIKSVATAFAWFLVVFIISTSFVGIYYFSVLLGLTDEEISTKLETVKLPQTISKNIKFELSSSSLKIKKGSEFKLETNNSKLVAKEKNGRVQIEEKGFNLIQSQNDKEVVLTIPENYIFENFEIETGAGLLKIDGLKTNVLDLELGAGKVEIGNLESYRTTEIDGGAGSIEIKSSTLSSLNLNMGVGKLDLTASVSGNIELDAGIGDMNLNLLENKEDFTVKISKGIGSVFIDNEEIKGNLAIGNGLRFLDIDGGIGNIKVKFLGE